MQKTGRTYLIPVILEVLLSPLGLAQSLTTEKIFGQPAAAREVLIKPQPWASNMRQQLVQSLDPEMVQELGHSGLIRLRSRSLNVLALLTGLNLNPMIAWVEPNYIVHSSDTLPNDADFSNLWGLRNTGQTINGQAGVAFADIDAVKAWDIGTGSSSIVVGVVDTGVDYNHPDLAANIWTAQTPYQISVGGVTYTCPAGSHGFNLEALNCDPLDDNTHGTHVAGTIGALGNNALGVTGINWRTSIAGFKFLNSSATGSVADAVNAIEAAIQLKSQGIDIRVLNNSWGVGSYSGALQQAVNDANSNDILFVAAAGNDGSNNDADAPEYPASFNTPNIISVAATDNRDNLSSISNYGQLTVHLGAPGINIQSTLLGGGYGYMSGTSMATAQVSGTAALVLSQCSLATANLKAAILNSVDPDPSLTGKTVTGGRVNVYNTLNHCGASGSPSFTLSASPTAVSAMPGGVANSQIKISSSGGFNGVVILSAMGAPAGVTPSFSPASVTGSGSSTITLSVSSTTPAGTYPIAIQGTSGSLISAVTINLTVGSSDFALSASPASVSAIAGGSAGSAITVAALNGFGGVVSLAASGMPTGVTASFSPASIAGAGNSALTLVTSASTPTGTFPITVQGISGGTLAHAVALNLTVTNQPAIILPANISVLPGLSASFPVSLGAPAAGSVFISLVSSDPSKVTVTPGTVVVPAGGTMPSVTPKLNGINLGSVMVTASAVNYGLASQQVQATDALSFFPTTATITGTGTQYLALNLAAPLPADVTVNLSSDNPSVATVPSSIVFRANTSSVTVRVTAIGGGSTLIHASALPSIPDVTASVTVGSTLAIMTAALPNGQIHTAYAQTLAATGGALPYHWALTSGALPSGLTLNATTGQISGTPTVAVTNTPLTFTVTDASLPPKSALASFTLTIASSGSAASITPVTGTPQTAAVNTAFGIPLMVLVKDTIGSPVSGVTVTFTAPPTGASGSFAGGNTATTDPSGMASSSIFSTNGIAGPYSVTASVTGVVTPAAFLLTNLAGPAASITLTSGSGQSAALNAAFTAPLVAIVRDAQGNLVSGVAVTFLAPSTGAGASFAASGPISTVTTNASGVATSPALTANSTPGKYNITASTPGVATPASFVLTNTGPPASVAVASGSGQSTTINTAFGSPLAVRILDAGGSPLPGVVVTFVLPGSGPSGAFSGSNTATTSASGVATSSTLTANSLGGSYTVSAAAAGLALSASFQLTNLSGIILPANISVAPGVSAPFPIALGVPAPAGGVFLALTSSDPSKVTITPASILIPAGATTPLLAPKVNGANLGSANITASAFNYTSVSQPVQVTDGLSFYPVSVVMNSSGAQYLTLNLSAPTPTALTIPLSSSNPGVASVPPTVSFAANATSATVRVTGVAAGSATITGGALPNVALATASVTVQ